MHALGLLPRRNTNQDVRRNPNPWNRSTSSSDDNDARAAEGTCASDAERFLIEGSTMTSRSAEAGERVSFQALKIRFEARRKRSSRRRRVIEENEDEKAHVPFRLTARSRRARLLLVSSLVYLAASSRGPPPSPSSTHPTHPHMAQNAQKYPHRRKDFLNAPWSAVGLFNLCARSGDFFAHSCGPSVPPPFTPPSRLCWDSSTSSRFGIDWEPHRRRLVSVLWVRRGGLSLRVFGDADPLLWTRNLFPSLLLALPEFLSHYAVFTNITPTFPVVRNLTQRRKATLATSISSSSSPCSPRLPRPYSDRNYPLRCVLL
ncbi:hypothetical protein C8R45DRAFT_1216390 [Mycena sanguinolenta]|nr:hypothetical protein C8R45DRAFT_1216390 [Mycena sanguinolenta]